MLSKLGVGRKITAKNLTQVEIVLHLRQIFHRFFLKTLSSIAQSYVDMVEKKKISGKVKSSNRGRKKNSARPRLLLVCWRQTTFPITFPIDDWIKTMILVFHWYSIVSVLLCKIWIHFLWRKCEYVMEIFFQKVSIYLLWRKFYEFESVWWYIVQSD